MSTGAKRKQTVHKGNTLTLSMGLTSGGTPINLTGYNVSLEVRVGESATTTVYDVDSGHAVVNGSLGRFQVVVGADITDTWSNGRYELKIISPTDQVTTLLFGALEVIRAL